VTRDDVLITEGDLEDLPELIKNYLLKAGDLARSRVRYFRVAMTGEMKMDWEKTFAPFQVNQYTFINSGARVFYIIIKYKGIPIAGLHHYYR
jgi:hypothetical protein